MVDAGKRNRKSAFTVGVLYAVFVCVIYRGEELEPPLDSCIVVSPFANAFQRLVTGERAFCFCTERYPGQCLGAQSTLPASVSSGVQCVSKSSVARLVYSMGFMEPVA